MNVVEVLTGNICQVEVELVEKTDFRLLTKSRYFFDWKKEKNYEIYKLKMKDSNEILGLISLERFTDEWRIHIRLLTVSIENKGIDKKYDKIAGNLIAHAAKIAVKEYGALACVSLRPKSKITQHYIDKYKMNITGLTLSLEVPEILNLINLFEDGR
ncbi:MAG: N-acetyltransferase [Saprospiraceae bacterium]